MQVNSFAKFNLKQTTFSTVNFQHKDILDSTVKVSVIVPIYNQEKYLHKAMDSLKKQTLSNLEFICINDGSTDNSLNILKDFAKNDKRFRIINQNNQGTGNSRNNGIKIAKGEYIAFMDPDDWLEPDAMEILYKKSKNENCDMVVYNFNNLNENGEITKKFNLKNRLQRFYTISEDKNFNWRNIKSKALGGLYPVVWNKFIKHKLIKDFKLHFSTSNIAEDNVFTIGATLCAENIGYCSKCLYNYVVHKNSALRTKSDKGFSIFQAIDAVKKLLAKLNLTKELQNEFDGYVIRFVSYHIKQIKSVEKFKNQCLVKLSPYQNRMLNERFTANKGIMPIIQALIRSKSIR